MGAVAAIWSATLCAADLSHVLSKDRIRIEIDGVDRTIADNVRTYLSLARYTQRENLTDDQVRRLADRAVDETSDALRPFGYYAPVVHSRTTRDDENWIVRLRASSSASRCVSTKSTLRSTATDATARCAR
jgi:hypothetical protein